MKYVKPDGRTFDTLAEATRDTTGVMILTDALYSEYLSTNTFARAIAEHFQRPASTGILPAVKITIGPDDSLSVHTTEPIRLHITYPATILTPETQSFDGMSYHSEDLIITESLRIERSL